VSLLKVMCVAGARPNFMKIAPLMEELERQQGIRPVLVHTGQHYDKAMSKLFFEELGIPAPHFNLEVGSASHAVQTARIMERFEDVLVKENPNLVIVVGDVNSTFGCALTAVKLKIAVAHVEAGLRSFDRTMPEEINRVLTDAISDFLFTTERCAETNLLREGIPQDKIYFVGNVMVDTLLKHKAKADVSNISLRLGIDKKSYGLVTLHRPSNVECKDTLKSIFYALRELSSKVLIIFPCHPRTQEKIREYNLEYLVNSDERKVKEGWINLIAPLGYLDFLKLMTEAKVVLTDSGGIQEETTILGIPCITMRNNTERPVTVSEGTNTIVGTEKNKIVEKASEVLNGYLPTGRCPELWDGRASERIVRVLMEFIKG